MIDAARRFRHGGWWVMPCAALWLKAALAVPVTVTFSTQSGSSAQDTVAIFDPLGTQPPPSKDTAIIDQINKQYVPRVTIVRTGTSVTFPNSDHIRHQVYSFSPPKVFALKLYAGSPPTAVTFDKPGLVVLGCNIHDKMVAFLGIVDTPYFAKADRAGNAIVNLPAGSYRLRVWHPGLTAAVPPREIEVDKSPVAIPLTVDINPMPAAVAAWPE